MRQLAATLIRVLETLPSGRSGTLPWTYLTGRYPKFMHKRPIMSCPQHSRGCFEHNLVACSDSWAGRKSLETACYSTDPLSMSASASVDQDQGPAALRYVQCRTRSVTRRSMEGLSRTMQFCSSSLRHEEAPTEYSGPRNIYRGIP